VAEADFPVVMVESAAAITGFSVEGAGFSIEGTPISVEG
jgi:hypothetical protein